MKAYKTLIIVISVIVLIPILGFFSWYLKKGQELEILFVNKSMTRYNGTENKSFNWILNNQKILRPGKALYNMNLNYFGLHTDGQETRIVYPALKDIDRLIEKTDLIYYADVTGIPASDLGVITGGNLDKPMYGGFNNTDYILSKKAIADGKKYIAECNYFGYPTEPLMRYNIEQNIDMYWIGWIGKHVPDLSISSEHEICYDYINAYVNQTGRIWDFTGPGLILIDQTKDRVVVLQEGKEVNLSGGFIYATYEARERFNIPEKTSYQGWFSLIHPGKNNVLCSFNINPSDAGTSILNANGLPDKFPAVVERNTSFYFLAGDFGKSNVNICFSRVYGINNLIDAMKRRDFENPSNFFYTFYKPLMKGLIEETLAENRDREN